MTCHDFEVRLDEALHRGERLETAELSGHIVSCARCRRVWDGARLLAEALAEAKANPPTVSLTDQVLARHRAKPLASTTPPGSRSPGWWRNVLAVSALIVLVALGAVFTFRPPAPQVAKAPVAKAPVAPAEGNRRDIAEPIASRAEPASPADRSEAPDLEELVRSAQSAYLALAQDATHTVRDAAEVIVPETTSVPSLDRLPVPPALDGWNATWPDRLDQTLEKWLDRRG